MSLFDRRTASILLTILLFAAGLSILYIARAVFVIFAFAILFAYLIDPLVRFLQRHSLFFKNLRGPHIAEAYLLLLVLVGISIYMLAPVVRSQAEKFKQIAALMEDESPGENAPAVAANPHQPEDARVVQLKAFLGRHRSNVQSVVSGIQRFASAAIGGVFLIPILAMFFLSSGGRLADDLIHLVSTSGTYEDVRSLFEELHTMMRHYIRAKVILGALSFAYCSVAMLALGFPNAVALGMVAGVLEFIPVAGWITAATTIITLGVLTHSHWIWMAALLGLWRILMDYWIAPRVIGHELELHPLLAIFTTMVGGAVGGIVGIYLSIPIVAVLRVIWRRSTAPKELSQTALSASGG